jgi:hypothetical protein
MQTKPTPTEGLTSTKLEAESALRDAACSAWISVEEDLPPLFKGVDFSGLYCPRSELVMFTNGSLTWVGYCSWITRPDGEVFVRWSMRRSGADDVDWWVNDVTHWAHIYLPNDQDQAPAPK